MPCHELAARRIAFERQRALPVHCKGVRLDCGYRLDMLIDGAVAVETKAVESLERIHAAQMLTYLKLGGWRIGLLINFNVPVLRMGVKRLVNNFADSPAASAPLR